MRSLIVEDDVTSRQLLRSYLATIGEVDVAENGIEALGYIMAYRYDLVCLDLTIPGISGREVLIKFRAYEESQSLPPSARAKVFITTSSKSKDDIFGTIFHEGGDEYLPKPLDLNQLEKFIKEYGLIDNP